MGSNKGKQQGEQEATGTGSNRKQQEATGSNRNRKQHEATGTGSNRGKQQGEATGGLRFYVTRVDSPLSDDGICFGKRNINLPYFSYSKAPWILIRVREAPRFGCISSNKIFCVPHLCNQSTRSKQVNVISGSIWCQCRRSDVSRSWSMGLLWVLGCGFTG